MQGKMRDKCRGCFTTLDEFACHFHVSINLNTPFIIIYAAMADCRVKIVVVGPKKAGKTVLANIMSGTSDTVDTEYTPTAGVRYCGAMGGSGGILSFFLPFVRMCV